MNDYTKRRRIDRLFRALDRSEGDRRTAIKMALMRLLYGGGSPTGRINFHEPQVQWLSVSTGRMPR